MPARKEYNAEGLKHCYKCGEWKDPLRDFSSAKSRADGRESLCKSCKRSYRIVHDKLNWDRVRSRNRENRLMRYYNITANEYNDMLTKQCGVCSICKSHCSVNDYLAVDHCHTTGVNRGLLCHNCNSAIGLLKEDPIIIDAALMYIINHRMRIQDNVG